MKNRDEIAGAEAEGQGPAGPADTRGESEATPARHFSFAERWRRRREERSTKAMWATLGLDLVLLVLIVLMVWVAFNAWE